MKNLFFKLCLAFVFIFFIVAVIKADTIQIGKDRTVNVTYKLSCIRLENVLLDRNTRLGEYSYMADRLEEIFCKKTDGLPNFNLLVPIPSPQPISKTAIDEASFQCLYTLHYISDALSMYQQTDEMVLWVGKQYCFFSSLINYRIDSLQYRNNQQYSPRLNFSGTTAPQIHISPPEILLRRTDNIETYIIHRKSGHAQVLGPAGPLNYYKYAEALSTPIWEISIETREILGYSCQKASTHYGGRYWTAWFAADIKMSEGPWTLRGLPGLILRAEDAEDHYVFECTSVKKLAHKRDVIKIMMHGDSPVSKDYYVNARQLLFDDPIAAYTQADIDLVSAMQESPSVRMPLPKKYNPIERGQD